MSWTKLPFHVKVCTNFGKDQLQVLKDYHALNRRVVRGNSNKRHPSETSEGRHFRAPRSHGVRSEIGGTRYAERFPGSKLAPRICERDNH